MGEGFDPRQVGPGFGQHGFRFRQASLRLDNPGAIGARIDRIDQLALLDLRAFGKIHAFEKTLDPGANRDVDVAQGLPHEILGYPGVPCDRPDHIDFGRWRRCRLICCAGTSRGANVSRHSLGNPLPVRPVRDI
jgi:hypothetical protein